jgi:hypothetical protein
MKPASLLLLLCSAATARAGVRVEVDPGAPFTEEDLTDAVEIRTPPAGPGNEVVVRVAKLGSDQLVVIVGDRSQVVTLPDRDRTSSSRVVALVVTSMLGDEPVAAAPPAAEPVIDELAPPPRLRRWFYQASGSITRDDNGYWIPFVHLGAARTIAPNVRIVGSVGIGDYDGYLDTSSTLVPVRVGLEGRAGAAAIELGWQMINYRETSCLSAEWGHAESAYGAAKLFVPLGQRTRIVGELGGHYVLGRVGTACNSATNYTAYGGWLGAGVEWAR